MNNKKVLIITYYWPPNGGGGVQRWLKFAKYLPDFGWDPIIYTPENPEYVQYDESLLQDIHPNTKVLKTKIWEPYDLFRKLKGGKKDFKQNQGIVFKDGKPSGKDKLALWVRSNMIIPDPRKYWIKPSIKFLTDYLEKNPVDLIITTSPPHSMQLIGLGLKKKFNIPWVADFRDPWTNWDILREQFNLTAKSLKKHKKMEREVIQNADLTLTVSASWEQEFKELGAKKTSYITNGFDNSDFTELKSSQKEGFKIGHYGLINQYRNPINLWKALDELLVEDKEFANGFELELIGTLSSSVQESILKHNNLAQHTQILPPVSHKEVLQKYKEANLLLLLSNNSENNKGHLPGKLFEYIGSGTSILGYTRSDSDCAGILKDLKHTSFLDEDVSSLKSILKNIIKKKGSNNEENKTFERKELTKKLSENLNKLLYV